jgi:hypothetical protein
MCPLNAQVNAKKNAKLNAEDPAISANIVRVAPQVAGEF